jgi:hypothetical protein
MRIANACVLALVLAVACTSSARPRVTPTAAATLERAPECDRSGDLCDRIIAELNQIRNAVPNAEFSGARRIALSGDGRFILTATLADPTDKPSFARDKIEALLRLQGWTRDASGARAAWKGAKQMTGWLFTFEATAQDGGSIIGVALYAPK